MFKYYKEHKDDILPTAIAVILLGGAILFGNIILKTKDISSPKSSGNTDCKGYEINRTGEYRSLDMDQRQYRTNDLNRIYEAEDEEYWEIEELDGQYYRVKREDRDKDYYGEDEFDAEDYIGGKKELYHYSKSRYN